MTPKVLRKIDAGLESLRRDQAAGNAPPPGEISAAEIARRSGVSATTVAKFESIARARFILAAIQKGLTHEDIQAILSPPHPKL